MTVSFGPVRMAAAAIVLIAGGVQASAQGYYYRPWPPEPHFRPVPPAAVPGGRFRDELPPWEIETILRSMGYTQVTRPRLTGPVYRVRATDRRGWRVALVVDTATGRIVERETLGAVTGPRGDEGPPISRPRPSQAARAPADPPAKPSAPRQAKPDAVPQTSLPPAPTVSVPSSPAPSVITPSASAPNPPPPGPVLLSPDTPPPAAAAPSAAKPSAAKPAEVKPAPAKADKPASGGTAAAPAKSETVTPETIKSAAPADAPAKPASKPAEAKPAAAKPAAPGTDSGRPIWAQRRQATPEAVPSAPQVPAKKSGPAVSFPPVQGFE